MARNTNPQTRLNAGRQLTDKSECSRDEVGTACVGAPINDHSSIPCSQESTETDGIALSGEETESPPGPPSQVGEQPCQPDSPAQDTDTDRLEESPLTQ